MHFTPDSLQFLFENHLRDSREWYQQNKETYKQTVVLPFRELVAAVQPTLLAIDSQILCEADKAPRVFRDTRIIKYSRDKAIFRDHVWRSFGRTREQYEALPSFYIEISPRGYSYGCGYYQAGPDSMAGIRQLILDDDSAFAEARAVFEQRPDFVLAGESYKRPHYPDQPPEKQLWLDRRSLCLCAAGTDFPLLFSDAFAGFLAEAYRAMAPFYRFLMKAEARVYRERGL